MTTKVEQLIDVTENIEMTVVRFRETWERYPEHFDFTKDKQYRSDLTDGWDWALHAFKDAIALIPKAERERRDFTGRYNREQQIRDGWVAEQNAIFEKREAAYHKRQELNEHAIQESVRKGRKPVYHGDVYLLPTGTKLNPMTGEGEYADDGQVAYVLRRTDKVRKNGASCVATSFGTVDMVVGDTLTVRHDQTRQRMGEYEIVGIKVFETGRGVGDVPNRKINHRVFK